MTSSSPFRRALRDRGISKPHQLTKQQARERRWIFVSYDQLSDQIGPLAQEDPEELGIILIESPAKGHSRPYHRQKLAFVLANIRQFALEQAERGVAVVHRIAPQQAAAVSSRGGGTYGAVLNELSSALEAPIRVLRPAERELRADLAPLVHAGTLEVLPHDGWLTTRDEFLISQKAPKDGKPKNYRMDRFYRHVRKAQHILMDADGKPQGGKFSFDADNRSAWRGDPEAPVIPTFRPDDVTLEVLNLVEREFGDHPGDLDDRALPATRADAEALWTWAKEECLPHFGPFQDAMAKESESLFHARISPLLHTHRLLPKQVVADVLAMDTLDLASQEGFVRQVLGWREFVRHVHEDTDGFRILPSSVPLQSSADGHAEPAFLTTGHPLPAAFWSGSGDAPSGLSCLDHVVEDVWRSGYGHHITRLMVLSNLATLLDVSPRELTDWFWVAYIDAYDWVVEPNVLGMGTFSIGDLMTTKPYIAGSAYIDKMSDYCGSCAFHPKKTCPIRDLYWAFLGRHQQRLADNPRLKLPLASARKRTATQKAHDEAVFTHVLDQLLHGETVTPGSLQAAVTDPSG